MQYRSKKLVAFIVGTALLWWPQLQLAAQSQSVTSQRLSLSHLVERPYLELLEISPSLSFTSSEIEAFQKQLEREKEAEKKRLEQEEKNLKEQIKQIRRQLDTLNQQASRDSSAMATERQQLQCQIYRLEQKVAEARTARDHGVGVAFDNKRAKAELIGKWPGRKAQIEQVIAAGHARQREHGDVEDIGIRVVGEGQEKDIKTGQDAVREMTSYGIIPPELADPAVNEYVRRLADAVAVSSDLRIPLKVTLLDSDEINAFALPGGYLYINAGLIAKADNESELVGVIAHELAHVTARHGARLMKRATIASIIFQAAQIAALIFTGGVVGIGTYYALQYGFFGLGLLLDLTLLGVSRDFEAEADQLGVQYAWRAGYDPRGFITFFDKMASEKGYVTSASFFRTHPPYFDRILATFSEIAYLPGKGDPQIDSQAFQEMKRQLQKVRAESSSNLKKRPTLRRVPQCEEEPPESWLEQ